MFGGMFESLSVPIKKFVLWVGENNFLLFTLLSFAQHDYVMCSLTDRASKNFSVHCYEKRSKAFENILQLYDKSTNRKFTNCAALTIAALTIDENFKLQTCVIFLTIFFTLLSGKRCDNAADVYKISTSG